MLYNIHVSREMTGGTLKGMVFDQVIPRCSEQPEIGSKMECKKAFGGGSYIDTVLLVEEFKGF